MKDGWLDILEMLRKAQELDNNLKKSPRPMNEAQRFAEFMKLKGEKKHG